VLQFAHKDILIGFALAFLGTALFSLKSIFIKLAYAHGLETNTLLFLRMVISLPIYLLILLYLIARRTAPQSSIKNHFATIVFLGFIGYFLASWLDLKGLEYISAGLERLTLFTYPIFVAIFGALFFKIPITKKLYLTLFLTYLGLWIIFEQEAIVGNNNTLLGVVLVLLSALSFSFYVLVGKRVIDSIGSLWFTAIAMCVSSIVVIGYYSIFFSWSAVVIKPEAWIYIFCLAIFSTVIPSFMISEAIARVGAAKTGVVGTLGPVITILVAVVILNEPFTLHHAIGTLLVIFGVVLLTVELPSKKSS